LREVRDEPAITLIDFAFGKNFFNTEPAEEQSCIEEEKNCILSVTQRLCVLSVENLFLSFFSGRGFFSHKAKNDKEELTAFTFSFNYYRKSYLAGKSGSRVVLKREIVFPTL